MHLQVESRNMKTSSDTVLSPQNRPRSATAALDLSGKVTKPDGHCSRAGGFSDVYKCRYTCAGGLKEVAVKVFRFHFEVAQNKEKVTRTAKMIRRELGIWKRLSHPNIVPFLGFVNDFERHGSTSLVSEWMPEGTLEDFFAQYDDQLILAHRLQLLLDIGNGISYLHSFPLVHGDLTCTNVLIDHNFNARLTDFGLASMVGDIPDGMRYLQMTTARPGAIRWAAPEHFSATASAATERTTKSDIYSFGNLALLTLSGKYPWSEVQLDIAVVLQLHQGGKPGRPTSRPIEDEHWEFIEHCWSAVDERPQAEDVVFSLKNFLDARLPAESLREYLGALSDPDIERPRPLDIPSKSANPNRSFSYRPRRSLPLDGPPSGLTLSASWAKSRRVPIPPLATTPSHFRLNPFLNGDTPCLDFYFDLASPSFIPTRCIGPGRFADISEDELRVPATHPSTARMRITHDGIPQWPINVKSHDGNTVPTTEDPITVGDVLQVIYRSLHMHIMQEDWNRVTQTKESEPIMRAATRRTRSVATTPTQAEVHEQVERIDYLLDKHVFKMLIRAHDEDGFHWRLITASKREYCLYHNSSAHPSGVDRKRP